MLDENWLRQKEVLHLPKVGLLEEDIHKNYLEIKWDLGHTKLLIEWYFLLWNVFNFVFFSSCGKRDSQIKVILVGLSLSPLLVTEHFRNLAQKSKNNNYRKNCKPNRY